jgi:hypothetical protein
LNKLQGGCLCGAIRYEANGEPFHLTNCHCTLCRGTTGAPYVAWLTVRRSNFSFTQGTPKRFASSANAARRFCGRCGTQLTFENDLLADEIDITTASLDDPQRQAPHSHTFDSSRIGWIEPGDGLPRFATTREDS